MGNGSTALGAITRTVDIDVALFRNVQIAVDVTTLSFTGDHVFLKIYPFDKPEDALFLGEVDMTNTWQANVTLENTISTLAYEMYTEREPVTQGSLTLDASSALLITGLSP